MVKSAEMAPTISRISLCDFKGLGVVAGMRDCRSLSRIRRGTLGFAMKAEYKEGKEASENFERLAKAVFRAPKGPKKQPKKAAKRRKTHGKNDG